MSTGHLLDATGRRIFTAAIASDRCGELLECLFGGGSATVDPSGALVLASAEDLAEMCREPDLGTEEALSP